MKHLLLVAALCASCFHPVFSAAQNAPEVALIDSINRMLDHAVVKKDRAVLEKYYAEDFFFLHSTGLKDTKKSWVKTVLSPTTRYASREHDSVTVEMHPQVAVLSGLLTVRPEPVAEKKAFRLRYIRVFAYRKGLWQMISHHSTHEMPVN
ncbi:MAG: nuclear transport factor 2 family protein [Mucilaginibacter polytrichastri]|nr:nuclear transport factor 2 family protein [Mucilaginibacter polytrichastri]